MKTFEIGQSLFVKDFYGKSELEFDTNFTVVSRTKTVLTVVDGSGSEFSMPIKTTTQFEWCHHAPALMIRPPEE